MKKQTEQGNRYALTTLKQRRAQLAGEIVRLEQQAAWKRSQLIHVDAALTILGADDPEAIKPVKPYKRVALFKQGELSNAVRDALRRGGKPMRTAEVTASVMAAMGHDDRALPAMAGRVRSSLEYLMTHKGTIVRTGSRNKVTWSLAVAPQISAPGRVGT